MLDRFRERAEALLEALCDDEYRVATGQIPASAAPELFDRSMGVFGPERVTELQRMLAGSSGEDHQRVLSLLDLCLEMQAARATAVEAEERRILEQEGVDVEGRRLPLSAIPDVLGDIADPDARAEVAERWLQVLDDEEDVLAGIIERHRGLAEEVGYGSYIGTRSVLSGVDLRGLGQDAARFLADTEEAYHELLAEYLPRLTGASTSGATMADLPRLARAHPFDAHFPGADMVPRIRAKIGSMGIDPLAGGRIRIDIRPDLRDLGAARCFPLRVPELLALAVSPRTGRGAYQRFLHELGYALHRAHTSPDLPMEFRWLGDESVSLAFALTFQGLLSTPAWVQRVHRVPKDGMRDYLRVCALVDLLRARTWAAQLHYELQFHDLSGRDAQRQAYTEILGGATGVRHDARAYLVGIEPGFRVAYRVRAEQLHAVVADYLRDRFGEAWFRDAEAGSALADLFASGRRFTAPQLAVQLSSAPLSFAPLRSRLEMQMG